MVALSWEGLCLQKKQRTELAPITFADLLVANNTYMSAAYSIRLGENISLFWPILQRKESIDKRK